MELNKLYNIDCLEGMKHIPDGSIDAIRGAIREQHGTALGFKFEPITNKSNGTYHIEQADRSQA